MSADRWWCDWLFSPSLGRYFREDEIFCFRVMILTTFVGMLLSWPWFNDQTLISCWFGSLSALTLILISTVLTITRNRIGYPIDTLMVILVLPATICHLIFFVLGKHVNTTDLCPQDRLDNVLSNFICWWPKPLYGAVLRDGLCLIIGTYSLVSLKFPHTPVSISDPFNGRPLNPPRTLTLNKGRQRREREQRQQRSPFVIHYVVRRVGQIRRRRKLLRN